MGALFVAVLKWLLDAKAIHSRIAYITLVALGYLYFFEVQPLAAEVADVKQTVEEIRVDQLERRLQEANTALCMEKGDAALLELIAELEKQFRDLTKRNYEAKSCDLLLKLK